MIYDSISPDTSEARFCRNGPKNKALLAILVGIWNFVFGIFRTYGSNR
jgi:hypothetical protein